ncbi:MAG: hypothetical protein HYS27_08900 [Deltaproteobacteria bacterium]|nr:hypothetical protein [Deltaproteobacteria bacterium]
MRHYLLFPVLFLVSCTGPAGPVGPKGATGVSGSSCSVDDNADGTYTLACDDGTNITIADGSPCTVADNGTTYALSCPDGTEVVVADGQSCTATDAGNGTHVLTCADGAVTIEDGVSCTVVDNLDTTYTMTCGTGVVTVADGTPCSVTGDGFATFTMSCGDGTQETFTLGQPPQPAVVGHIENGHVLAYDVQAAYNSDTFFWRLSYRGNRGDHHDYLRFTGGAWRNEGGDRRDAQSTLDNDPQQGETDLNSTIYEQRTSIMLSDPNAATHVTRFQDFGCFITCHDQARHMPKWEEANGEDTKWVNPADMTGSGTVALDLWHWRGHRSGPIARADDQFVEARTFTNTLGADDGGRKGDAGSAVFTTNSIVGGNPSFVFDPATTNGGYAFKWGEFWSTPYYYVTDASGQALGPKAPNPSTLSFAAATTAGYVPSEGDVVPRRVLRAGSGSRADITAVGTEFVPESPDGQYGVWHVQLQRALNTGNSDDVALTAGSSYAAAFEVHLWEYTTRDHYVSFPQSVSLNDPTNTSPDIRAVLVAGSGKFQRPDFDDVTTFPVTRLYLFQPGIASWEFLTGADAAETYTDPATGQAVNQVHGGSALMTTAGSSCRGCHNVRATDPASVGPPMATASPQRGGIFAQTPVP